MGKTTKNKYRCGCCGKMHDAKEAPPKTVFLDDNSKDTYCPSCHKRLTSILRPFAGKVKDFKGVKRPILRKVWEGFWSDLLEDYILWFDQTVVNYDEDTREDTFEAFLRGMAKGMWIVYDMVDKMLVNRK